MQRIRLNSSIIESVGYDNTEEEILEIRFRNNGKIFRYYNVPVKEFGALLVAESHGKYFSSKIKYGYRYEEVKKEA